MTLNDYYKFLYINDLPYRISFMPNCTTIVETPTVIVTFNRYNVMIKEERKI